MEIVFSVNALKDLKYWRKTNNTEIQNRIKELIESILENPKTGIGNPEPLKHEYSGCWSRRINKEHRIIYNFDDEKVNIISLRMHYK